MIGVRAARRYRASDRSTPSRPVVANVPQHGTMRLRMDAPTTTGTSAVTPLDYAPAPPLLQRRHAISALWVMGIALLGLIGWKVIPVALHRAELMRMQRECLHFSVAPDAKISTTQRTVPPAWSAMCRSVPPFGFNSHGTIFLHELRTPSGERRLVGVDAYFSTIRNGLTMVFPRIYTVGSLRRPPTLVSQGQGGTSFPGQWEFSQGQPDPAEPRHFTFVMRRIDASSAGEERTPDRTIDGWLDDDDRVGLEQRRE